MPQIFSIMIIAFILCVSGCVSQSRYDQSARQYQKQLDNTRFLVGLLATGTVIALIAGAAMGSKARKDAQIKR